MRKESGFCANKPEAANPRIQREAVRRVMLFDFVTKPAAIMHRNPNPSDTPQRAHTDVRLRFTGRMKSFPIVFGLLLAAGAATAQQYTISTIAGTPNVFGYYPNPYTGAANVAQFTEPISIAVDKKGNLYVGDTLNYVVSEISGGNITALAGTGTRGFGYNPAVVGNTAAINDVHGVGIDLAGNTYFADTGNGT